MVDEAATKIALAGLAEAAQASAVESAHLGAHAATFVPVHDIPGQARRAA